MDQFFNWLSKPMNPEDIETWYQANNIIPEYTQLFEDFTFSLYYLIRETYLGYSHNDTNDTKIGLTYDEKLGHFKWCLNKTIQNFKKENINFEFSDEEYNYFESFYFELFYNQENKGVRDSLEDFFKQLFNQKRAVSKSDIEMFTDLYKRLERSLIF